MAHLGLTGDFPMPNRADLMSLQTINAKKDGVATTTNKFSSMRNLSNNLATSDIQGKFDQNCVSKQIADKSITVARRCSQAARLPAGQQA